MSESDSRPKIFNGERLNGERIPDRGEFLDREDPIFPVVRSNAPLLERIRNRNNDQNVAEDLGELVGQIVKTDDLEQIEETRKDFTEGFKASLAEELGVNPEDVSDDLVNEITDLVTQAQETDALRQRTLENLGITEGSEEGTEEAEESEAEESGESTGEQAELFESADDGSGEEEEE